MILNLIFAALMLLLSAAVLIFWPRRAKTTADQSQKELFRERLQLLVQARDYGELADEDFATAAAELKSQFLVLEQQRQATPEKRHFKLEFTMLTVVVLVVAISYSLNGHYQQLTDWETAQQNLPSYGERSLLNKGEPLSEAEMTLFGLALRTKLANEGDDAVAWFVLGRIWFSQGLVDEAIESFERALSLTPDRSNLLLSYAQALLVTESAENLQKAARSLGRVLEVDPGNQDALAMLALIAQERGDFAEAKAAWQVVLAQIPADDPRRSMIEQQLAQLPAANNAEQATNSTNSDPLANSTATATNEKSDLPTAGRRISLELTIPPELATKFANATLFVVAKAVAGSPMPLAVQKLPVKAGTQQIELTSAMVMQAGWGLDNVDEVMVSARLSQSGAVTKTAGDPEVQSAVLDLSKGPVKLSLTME
ncbi:c-type cytochrome biogenesis protein CcmI [Rheinheimera sp. SA_1]|uniref:c-type cytochrome biogenesis protein CcmI n=1 Tax=Rheinheimera sp. SA_1 TaxID=1827365 RepID=UPI0007FFC756|nr:c-type cytochrome biogenesis protein CcmI [Rheinheimera sp. SA_1]OBP15271.1 c-type cytochrome biogenesis protein CcmI [Rheinheimera sp. SA_1]